MKKGTGKVLAAMGAGAIIGAGAGILFAPRKGSDTRKKIKESFVNLKDKLSNISEEDVQEFIEKKLDEIDREINTLELMNNYKQARRQAKKVIKKINKLISYTAKKKLDGFEDLIEDLRERAEDISEEILTNLEK